MIDYVPTEIVAYADDFPLTFDEAYPLRMLSTTIVKYENSTYGYDIAPTNSVLGSDGTLAAQIPELVGNRIFGFILRTLDGVYYKQSEVLNSVGVCYYVISDAVDDLGLPIYYKLTKSDIPSNIENPFGSDIFFDFEGDDIYWLYNLGSSLVSSSSFVGSLLNFKIGNYNLLGLLFGGGFIVYVGWVIVKWVIPL